MSHQEQLSAYFKYRLWFAGAAGVASCLVLFLYSLLGAALQLSATGTRMGELYGYVFNIFYELSILFGVIAFFVSVAGYFFFTRRMGEVLDPTLYQRRILKLRVFLVIAIFVLPFILLAAPFGMLALFSYPVNFPTPVPPPNPPGSY